MNRKQIEIEFHKRKMKVAKLRDTDMKEYYKQNTKLSVWRHRMLGELDKPTPKKKYKSKKK